MEGWLYLLQNELPANVMAQAREACDERRDVADLLLRSGAVSAQRLMSALALYHNLPYTTLSEFRVDPDALSRLPYEVAQRFGVLPLFSIDDVLHLAVSDPIDLHAQDYVRQVVGSSIDIVLATRDDIEKAVTRNYLGAGKAAENAAAPMRSAEPAAPTPQETRIQVQDEEAPIIRLVNNIFSQGVRLGASDVHLEPLETQVRLRYRIDGMLVDYPAPPLHAFRSVVSRVKIMSNLNIAEKRLPQDGRFRIGVDGKDYDMRVSILPNIFGEGMVCRVIDPNGGVLSLEALGMPSAMLEKFDRAIRRPYGMVLVTGPTGSGKSTTLYAALKRIIAGHRKMITLEDPVESLVEGITQIQVNAEIGYTFAQGLRAILRHDPDVIMVGEIRDTESAEIALRASLTGHMMFSTLHTNDACQGIIRLADMGLPPYLVLSSLSGVVAQRLVRRLCDRCKIEVSMRPSDLEAAGVTEVAANARFFRPAGCSHCDQLGYHGRVGIFEYLQITPAMRRLGNDELTPGHVAALADPSWRSLREAALEKVYTGVTSLEEILSITAEA